MKAIRFLNRIFPILMILIISSTFFIYKTKKNAFISNSVDHTIIIDHRVTEDIKSKLEELTFQDVEIQETDGVTYIKVRCPPDRFKFFSKWISDKYEGEK